MVSSHTSELNSTSRLRLLRQGALSFHKAENQSPARRRKSGCLPETKWLFHPGFQSLEAARMGGQ